MGEKMNQWLFRRSGRLFARPSFIEGIARILDLGATLNIYNEDKNDKEADGKALWSDWLAVGDALRDSVNKFEKDQDLDSENEISATA